MQGSNLEEKCANLSSNLDESKEKLTVTKKELSKAEGYVKTLETELSNLKKSTADHEERAKEKCETLEQSLQSTKDSLIEKDKQLKVRNL